MMIKNNNLARNEYLLFSSRILIIKKNNKDAGKK